MSSEINPISQTCKNNTQISYDWWHRKGHRVQGTQSPSFMGFFLMCVCVYLFIYNCWKAVPLKTSFTDWCKCPQQTDWAKSKPGVPICNQVFHLGGRDPSTWATVCCSSTCKSTNSGVRSRQRAWSQLLWYKMWACQGTTPRTAPECHFHSSLAQT